MSTAFENIRLGGRGTSAEGTLNVSDTGLTWQKAGGSNPRVFSKESITQLLFSGAPAGGLLRVRQDAASTAHFHGFSKSAEAQLLSALTNKLGMDATREELSLSGHNWGRLAVHGKSLAFLTGEGEHVVEVPLAEVAEVQASKEEAILEFHVDDGALRGREDALASISFVLPTDNDDFPGDAAAGRGSAEALREAVQGKTDALAGEGDALAALANVRLEYPRGRFDLAFFPAFLDVDGPSHSYKIRYTNIERIYILPRGAPAGTLVLVHLESALRRGQTYYDWVAMHFDAASSEEVELAADADFIAKKNKANKANLEATMAGAGDQVTTRLLRGLSGAKVSKATAGTFRAADGESVFVGCSYRTDAGVFYPLERALLYVFKPELIPFDHIASIEFERQQTGTATALRTFDLTVNIKSGSGTFSRSKVFQFRSIATQEWQPLLAFLESKSVKVVNPEQARQGPAGQAAAPPPLAAADEEDEEADADFGGGEGEGDDDEDADFGGSGSGSGSDSDSSDAEMIAEEGISVAAVSGRPSKRKSEPEDDAEDQDDDDAEDDEVEEEEEEEKPKKKPAKAKASPKKKAAAKEAPKKKKAKKDPDAPKRGLSAYFIFAGEKRPEVKEENPSMPVTEIAKAIAAKWKELDADDKKPYEEKAKADKARYEKEMEAYKKKQADAPAAADDEEDDE